MLGQQPGLVTAPERTTGLLRQMAEAADPAEQKALAAKLQAAFHRNVNYLWGGQFLAPAAYRSDVKGVVPFAFRSYGK